MILFVPMSVDKTLPFEQEPLQSIAEQYGTPVFVYDEAGIRGNAQTITEAFNWS